jgi:hypothetical protein
MTISTTGENPFSITFLMLNFLVFWVLKFSVLKEICERQSVVFVYTTIILLSLVTSFIYILISIYKTHKFEISTREMSMYVEEYKCNLFMGRKNTCFLLLKGKECEVYINQLFFVYSQYRPNRAEYILKLKARFVTLNKIDILYIYLYRYMKEILTSVSLIVIFQICSGISKNTSSELVFLTIVLLLSILFCYTVIQICMIATKRSIEKNNLELFVSK